MTATFRMIVIYIFSLFNSRKDRTKTGHALGDPGSRPTCAEPQRKMSPIVCGLLRIIMHSAMVMGACRNAPVSSLISRDFFSLILWFGLGRGGIEIGYRGGLMCQKLQSQVTPNTRIKTVSLLILHFYVNRISQETLICEEYL